MFVMSPLLGDSVDGGDVLRVAGLEWLREDRDDSGSNLWRTSGGAQNLFHS